MPGEGDAVAATDACGDGAGLAVADTIGLGSTPPAHPHVFGGDLQAQQAHSAAAVAAAFPLATPLPLHPHPPDCNAD